MKQTKLAIKIKKPVHDIFIWLLDPSNTPKWISSIVKEERNENPTKLGTIYRNLNKNGKWNQYKIMEFEEDKLFTFSLNDGNYSCCYTFRPFTDNIIELTYFEWVEKGDIEEPFTIETLEKLKKVLE